MCEGAADSDGALKDGELLSDRGSKAVNERAAQVCYTSPETDASSNVQQVIIGASIHAADFDV